MICISLRWILRCSCSLSHRSELYSILLNFLKLILWIFLERWGYSLFCRLFVSHQKLLQVWLLSLFFSAISKILSRALNNFTQSAKKKWPDVLVWKVLEKSSVSGAVAGIEMEPWVSNRVFPQMKVGHVSNKWNVHWRKTMVSTEVEKDLHDSLILMIMLIAARRAFLEKHFVPQSSVVCSVLIGYKTWGKNDYKKYRCVDCEFSGLLVC